MLTSCSEISSDFMLLPTTFSSSSSSKILLQFNVQRDHDTITSPLYVGFSHFMLEVLHKIPIKFIELVRLSVRTVNEHNCRNYSAYQFTTADYARARSPPPKSIC